MKRGWFYPLTKYLALILMLFCASSAQAAEKLEKVVFVQEWPVADGFWIPWLLGKEKGFYREEGIDLNIVAPPTVSDTMKYLGTGRADVAFTTAMDIIFAREQEAPVRAIARYGTSNNWGIFTPAGQPVTLKQLKGKMIGTYNDAWSKAQLSLMLAHEGMTLQDVTLVNAADDTVPLLLQHRVAAITGITNAEGTELATAGQKNAGFIPAIQYGAPDSPILMLAGNEEWLKAHPVLAQAFVRATLRSMEYAVAHPEEGIQQFLHDYSKAYDPAFVRQQWMDTIKLFGSDVGSSLVMNIEQWQSLLNAVSHSGMVKKIEPADSYFTNEFLKVEQ